MKKFILISVFFVLLFSYSAWSQQCTSCDQSNIDLSVNASGVGQNNTANGQASFVMGNGSISNGAASGAFGINTEAYAAAGFAMGRKIKSSATSAIVFGSGYAYTQFLINGKDNTLMIGFNSTAPTFFISKSLSNAAHPNLTGKVGIGNVTAPEAKLHIKSDEGEIASVYVQSNSWNLESKAEFFLGNKSFGLEANARDGLIFNAEGNYLFGKGNVGMGLLYGEIPEAKLHVNGVILTYGFKMPQDNMRDGWVLTADRNGNSMWAPSQNLWFQTEANDVYRPTGNVGIGMDNPLAKLEVKGQVSIGYHVNPALQENNLVVQGRVGVGTFSPSVEMEVVGKLKTTQLQILDGHLNGYILQCDNEGNASWINPTELNVGGWLQLANNVYVEGTRFVGIGTSTPTQPLDVVGNIKLSGDIFGGRTSEWPPLRIFAGTNENDGAYMLMSSSANQNGSIKFFARGAGGCVEFFNAERQIMSVRDNGNVYIGDPNNQSDLMVYGEIKAHLVRVTTDIDWFDYVFDKDYQLMPLHQLEAFVNEHHHLPDMPTEQQVHEEGLDIAQMNALLLKKVEELTLYIIEQEKRIEQLEKKSDY
ncbi:MAG: hypothetical protein KKF98_07115 [Bacteroidetes bacterium]|nr:hypothetical protein [Bacteroidota bacterium]